MINQINKNLNFTLPLVCTEMQSEMEVNKHQAEILAQQEFLCFPECWSYNGGKRLIDTSETSADTNGMVLHFIVPQLQQQSDIRHQNFLVKEHRGLSAEPSRKKGTGDGKVLILQVTN